MRKLRIRVVNQLAWVHLVSKKPSQNLNPDLSELKPMLHKEEYIYEALCHLGDISYTEMTADLC